MREQFVRELHRPGASFTEAFADLSHERQKVAIAVMAKYKERWPSDEDIKTLAPWVLDSFYRPLMQALENFGLSLNVRGTSRKEANIVFNGYKSFAPHDSDLAVKPGKRLMVLADAPKPKHRHAIDRGIRTAS